MFAAAVCLSLFMVGVCAVWPAGLPRTSPVGSAFSPATVEVAVRGRADQLRAATPRIAIDDDARPAKDWMPAVHQPALLPADQAFAPALSGVECQPGPRLADPPHSCVDAPKPYPRGPPIV